MNASQAPASCCSGAAGSRPRLSGYLPSWLGGTRGLILAAVVVVGGGAIAGWPWLVAIGAAPLLLSALPCMAMCALGLCMMGKGRQAAAPQSGADTSGAGLTTSPPLLTQEQAALPTIARESAAVS